jgi:hypothetical protein
VWPPSIFAVPVPSFVSPVLPPGVEPGASPFVTVCINELWLPYVRGALTQLLLQSTWGDPVQVNNETAQKQAAELIARFQSGQCGDLTLPDWKLGWSTSPSGPFETGDPYEFANGQHIDGTPFRVYGWQVNFSDINTHFSVAGFDAATQTHKVGGVMQFTRLLALSSSGCAISLLTTTDCFNTPTAYVGCGTFPHGNAYPSSPSGVFKQLDYTATDTCALFIEINGMIQCEPA